MFPIKFPNPSQETPSEEQTIRKQGEGRREDPASKF